MIRAFMKSLIRQCDPQAAAARSFKNFHAPGVAYVNLLYGPELKAKLYFIDHEKVQQVKSGFDDTDIVVNPHTHQYDFDTYVLAGEVHNYVYSRESTYRPVEWHEHRYVSPLRQEDRRSEYVGPVNLSISAVQCYSRGEGYSFDHRGIHSISLGRKQGEKAKGKDKEVVLFLLQYRKRNSGHTSLFTPTPGLPDMSGLYQPMLVGEVQQYLERALEYVKKKG